MLLEQLKNNRDSIFNPLPFMRVNKRLRNFNLYQVSFSLRDPVSVDDMITSAIVSEINSNINRRVVKEIGDTKNHDAFDVTGYGDLGCIDYQKIHKILDFILHNRGDYKNIITSPLLCQILQDCALFRVIPITNNGSNGTIYNIGDISGINIWADPYMKYSDHRLFLFDHVDINIEDVNFKIIDEMTFSPRLGIEHKLAINVSDSMVLFLLDDKTSPEYQQFKSLLRDKTIDNILHEGKEE